MLPARNPRFDWPKRTNRWSPLFLLLHGVLTPGSRHIKAWK